MDGLKLARPDAQPFVMPRATSAGGPRYGAGWTGDNTSTWEHLRLSVSMVLGLSVSGFPFVGPDIGGFIDGPDAELGDRGAREQLELGHGERLADVEQVQQVMGDAVSLGRTRLGGPDVHAAIDRHGGGVDDLAAEPLGKSEGETGLAGGSRPDHSDDRGDGHGG